MPSLLKILLSLLLIFGSIKTMQSQQIDTRFQQSLYAVLNFTHQANDSIVIGCSPIESAYLRHYHLFLSEMINGESSENYSNQFKSLSDTLSKYSDSQKHSLAFLSEIYLQKAIMEYGSDKQSEAILSIFKAYRYWQKSESLHAGLIHNLKLKGIFNLLMSNMPQPYNRWAGWIGFKGDSQTGLEALQAYSKAVYNQLGSKQDAMLHLAFAYLKFETNDKQIEILVRENHNNQLVPIVQFALTRCALKIRKPSLAQIWFTKSSTQAFLPMLYLQGKCQMLSFNNEAKTTLANFIQKNISGQFVADAHRNLSWYYFLAGDTSSYQKEKKNISNLKSYPTWEDKQANYENNLNAKLNKKLLQSRLLFDVGKYKAAVDTLTLYQTYIKAPEENIELQYRMGRCYQLLNEKSRAIFHYTEAVKMGDNDLRYFAPYAALFIAELYLDENPVTAKFYLDEAKRLNNGEHKTDITNKINLINQRFK